MEKDERKSKEIEEPTLGEVLAVMNERFTLVENRIDQRFGMMNERVNGVDAHLGDLQRGQTKLQNQVADIQDDLASALHASDKDALTIVNHERRIVHLEKVCA